jgi:hypothetical protein
MSEIRYSEEFHVRGELLNYILARHEGELLKLRLTEFGLNLTSAERHALLRFPDEFGVLPERSALVEQYEEHGPGISPAVKALLATLREERGGRPVPLDVLRDAWREAQRRRLYSARTSRRASDDAPI